MLNSQSQGKYIGLVLSFVPVVSFVIVNVFVELDWPVLVVLVEMDCCIKSVQVQQTRDIISHIDKHL